MCQKTVVTYPKTLAFIDHFIRFHIFLSFTPLVCSVGLQDRLERLRQHLVADLGVGNGPVLLAQVKAQLALVAEVKVALFTLVNGEVNRSNQQRNRTFPGCL